MTLRVLTPICPSLKSFTEGMANVMRRLSLSRTYLIPRRAAHKSGRQRGFSLVEVMVGLLISLIGTLAMMTAFASFEAQKRTTTSGSDAQQAGSYSLFEMARQLRTAGSAIEQGRDPTFNTWMCSISARTSAAATMPLPAPLAPPFDVVSAVSLNVRAIPALVYSGGTDGAGKALPDVIAVISGNPAVRTFGAKMTTVPPPPATAAVMADTTFGTYANEYLLASDGSGACRLAHVAPTFISDPTGAIKTVPFDVPNTAGNGFATPAQAYVFDLGVNPTFSLYGVNTTSNRLVAYDLLQRNGAAPVEIADGIVLVKALYGVDDGASGGTANDGVIDEWVVPTGATWGAAALSTPAAALSIPQIKAIRVAVVARSQLPERTIAADPVNGYAGPVPITLFSDLPAALQFSVNTDPQYRYKTYDTTIPLHNAAVKIL